MNCRIDRPGPDVSLSLRGRDEDDRLCREAAHLTGRGGSAGEAARCAVQRVPQVVRHRLYTPALRAPATLAPVRRTMAPWRRRRAPSSICRPWCAAPTTRPTRPTRPTRYTVCAQVCRPGILYVHRYVGLVRCSTDGSPMCPATMSVTY